MRCPPPSTQPFIDAGLPSGDAGGTPAPSFGSCAYDSDCTQQAYGRCLTISRSSGGPGPYRSCVYGCVSDDQCSTGEICRCGEQIGTCSPADCTTDARCPTGKLCLEERSASYAACGGLPSYTYVCGVIGTECGPERPCPGSPQSARCEHATCVSSPVCGRPFLVEGRDVRAASIRRDDYAHALAPDLSDLTSAERETLAAYYTEVGLMEHASVAAFARFSLQLLSLGAPADLLLSTHSALADELEHTRLAFGLASAYGGAPVGPGALAMDHALGETSLVELVRTAYLEACVGETCAAVEASEARQAARDPAVHGVLTRIAEDELRHAVLGYRFVEWALQTSTPADRAEIRAMLERELAGLVEAGSGTSTECVETALTAHGLLPDREREATRRIALRDVVAPATRALLGPSVASVASDAGVDTRPELQSLSVA